MALLTLAERTELQARAVAAWEQAKSLTTAAHGLVSDSRVLRHDVRAQRPRLSADEVAIHRVDLIVEARKGSDLTARSGVGLVVASRMTRMGGLHDSLQKRLSRVWAARDPAGALGLAIVNQPDIVLVDDDLPMVTGLDAALTIKTYTPRSEIVLFSDDNESLSQAGRAGLRTSQADFSVDHVLSVVDALLAA